MSTLTVIRKDLSNQTNNIPSQQVFNTEKNQFSEPQLHDQQNTNSQDSTTEPNQNSIHAQPSPKTNDQNVFKEKIEKQENRYLSNIQSVEQLKFDFQENKKIFTSISFNIDDLFKKINSLTELVQNEISPKPGTKSTEKAKKSESPPYRSQRLINHVQPLILHKFSSCLETFTSKDDGIFSIAMFEIGKSLGYGKFGEVLLCRHKQTGFLYALKKIFKSTIEQYSMKDQLLTQLQSCRRMNHPNIIRSYISFTDNFHIFLLSEYISGSILTKKFKSSEKEITKIIRQVLEALKYMHENGVVHRDLKPENIIIDESGIIKICDFGWASIGERQCKMNIICGTLDYVSPEMVGNIQYTKEVDLWSLGVLTYQLLFGSAPFKAPNRELTFEKVKKLEFSFPETVEPFSPICIDFISKLLKPQTQRMSLQQCFEHPFIKDSSEDENDNPEFVQLFE